MRAVAENLTRQILRGHLAEGDLRAGAPIAVGVDQALLQDATGTMAFLQYEQLGVPRVNVDRAVQYVDHNVVQLDFKNPDDHRMLQALARKHGVYFSRPGNGISHYVHLERFGKPGDILVGADSHTTTGGALGMIAVGAGGLDVAVVMAGFPYEIVCPAVVEVHLTRELARPWVQAKDVILELLRRLTVTGGKDKVFEFGGPGLADLSVPERGTIANMIAELGATAAVSRPTSARATGCAASNARMTSARLRLMPAVSTTSASRSTSVRSARSWPGRTTRTTWCRSRSWSGPRSRRSAWDPR